MHEKNILIIDDEKDLIQTIQEFFENDDFNVNSALDYDKAMLELKAKKFELIILDMKMPRVDGIEILKIINRQHPESKVIVLTGYGSQYRRKLHGLRYEAFVSKPFSAVELITIANDLLAERDLYLNDELYDNETIMPKAKLLFFEANELAYGGKKMYFTDKSKCGGEYTVDVLLDPKNIEEKLKSFKPDIVLGDTMLLGAGDKLQKKILLSKNRPRDIIVYGFIKNSDKKIVEGYFDPITSIFAKDVMDKLGKAVREAAIRYNLYEEVKDEIHIPGLDIQDLENSQNDKKHNKIINPDDIPHILKMV
ncbi:MAG: response regulator, partial [Candidatus Omnitrophota bacterium]